MHVQSDRVCVRASESVCSQGSPSKNKMEKNSPYTSDYIVVMPGKLAAARLQKARPLHFKKYTGAAFIYILFNFLVVCRFTLEELNCKI